MRVISLVVLAAVAAALAAPAEAATKRKRVAKRFDPVAEYRGTARTRTRITVRKQRSYLDPGTEVYPGSMNYTDYAFPPNDYPFRAIDPTGAGRYPLPGPFDLPSYHSPGNGWW